MKKKLYTLYDPAMPCHGLPFCADIGPDDMPFEYKKLVRSDINKALENHLHEKDLYLHGTFNEETGSFEILDKPVLVLHIREVFPADQIKKLEEQAAMSEQVFKQLQEANHA